METSGLLATAVAALEAIPMARVTEDQRWRILDAIEALRVACDACGLNAPTCPHCDTHCRDLAQP
jgi:hypothetical protein